jgi:hypothetical protein
MTASKHPRLVGGVEAHGVCTRVGVGGEQCRRGRVWVDGGVIGMAASSRVGSASCVGCQKRWDLFFFSLAGEIAGIMVSVNGSSYDNYRCLALD